MGKLVEEFLRETQKSSLFEKTLREANDESGYKKEEKKFFYNGTNQHTLEAWIRVDTPEKEHERVYVSDNFGSHNWHRSKSNENVRGNKSDGKGFSFFFTRYAYSDKFKYDDESYVTNTNPDYSSFLASIPFENFSHFDFIKNDENLRKILAPKNSVLLVVDTNSTDIISSYYTKKDEHVLAYSENRARILTESQRSHELSRWLGEQVESNVVNILYNKLIDGYEQFNEFLLYLDKKFNQ